MKLANRIFVVIFVYSSCTNISKYHLTYVCVIIWTNKSQTKRRSSTDLQGVRYTSEECAEQLNRRHVSSYRNSFLIQQNDSK